MCRTRLTQSHNNGPQTRYDDNCVDQSERESIMQITIEYIQIASSIARYYCKAAAVVSIIKMFAMKTVEEEEKNSQQKHRRITKYFLCKFRMKNFALWNSYRVPLNLCFFLFLLFSGFVFFYWVGTFRVKYCGRLAMRQKNKIKSLFFFFFVVNVGNSGVGCSASFFFLLIQFA